MLEIEIYVFRKEMYLVVLLFSIRYLFKNLNSCIKYYLRLFYDFHNRLFCWFTTIRSCTIEWHVNKIIQNNNMIIFMKTSKRS